MKESKCPQCGKPWQVELDILQCPNCRLDWEDIEAAGEWLDRNQLQQNIGRFARSIESGWLGKIVALEGEFYKMQGVNMLCWQVAGGSIEDHIDGDDTQWFVPEDVKLVQLV